MTVLTRHCSSCGAERLFEQPSCPDGHGESCPEWACVECGTAMIIGIPEPVPSTTGRAAVLASQAA
jgi:hypothetical protein